MYNENRWNRFYEKREKDEKKEMLWLQKRIFRNSLFHKMPSVDYYDYQKIYIDVDSIFSRFIADNLPLDENDRKELLNSIMRDVSFLIGFYSDDCRIIFIWGLKENTIFTNIYKDWQKERNGRLKNDGPISFIKNEFLPRMKLVAKKIRNISVVEYKDSFVTEIARRFETHKDAKDSLIISRNTQCIALLAYYDTNIFNGKELVSRSTYRTMKEYPDVHYSMIPWYYLIKGDERNGYKGVKGLGRVNTIRIIEKEKEKIINESHSRIQGVLKYKPLYFILDLL